MIVLGISCYYHDAAVALVDNDKILFAIQEERLSRVKHDSRFPTLAIGRALEYAGIEINDVDGIVFYENPELKLQRLWDQVIDKWPLSSRLFLEDIPHYLKYKLPVAEQIRQHLGYRGVVSCTEHHRSHAASAFFTSPFERAIVLTVDGVGEYDSLAVHIGEGNSLKKIRSIHFPDSLGLLYSVFTNYLGFEVNEGEYKVMGLAPYGRPAYRDKLLGPIIRIREDGSFALNQSYFDFNAADRHYALSLVEHLGVKPRASDSEMLQEHMDLAASVQDVLETALIAILKPLLSEFNTKDVCLAGGVALNCTANARLIRECGVRLHVHPAAGDAGGALGAALQHVMRDSAATPIKRFHFDPYLGMSYPEAVTLATLNINSIAFHKSSDAASEIADRLVDGKVVGIVNGRDEWGPRALGARSILADPRTSAMKEHVNARIKFREEFRPFAPAVKADRYGEYFETLGMAESPFMLFTHRALKPDAVGAVVHVDGTSRVQTVSPEQNSYFYGIIDEFEKRTGVPVVLNTSFNLRGEPMVSSPSDALQTFYASGIDSLAIGNVIVDKPSSS